MNNMEHITQNEIDRFNSKWTKDYECKLWNKNLDKDGYGIFYFRKKNRKAHRVSYFIKFGSIEDGLVVDHICKKRNCVEVSHLRLVTKSENTLNNSLSVGAINRQKVFCKFGHKFDRKYGKQRYCSICENAKSKRLRKKWLGEANNVKC